MGATCGGGSCQYEAYDVGDDLESDDPPRIIDFDFCAFGCIGVVEDFLYLLFCDFYFHDKYAFVFVGKGIKKKRHFVVVSLFLYARCLSSRDVFCIIYYIVKNFL